MFALGETLFVFARGGFWPHHLFAAYPVTQERNTRIDVRSQATLAEDWPRTVATEDVTTCSNLVPWFEETKRQSELSSSAAQTTQPSPPDIQKRAR